ncbi:MAG: GTP cyclohydrolase I FolE2, partial [Silvanigrellaceae bacterium]|nr:GTP cyclohydrolase I FolE2 [Silvanigrellaceae bacterium]
ALGLKQLEKTAKFQVSAENFESIHSHNAWALVKSTDL